MNYKNMGTSITATLITLLVTISANAANYIFNFTAECDDCAFNGSPFDANFNPIGDGLTQTVTATLTLVNAGLTQDGLVQNLGGTNEAIFSYHGSSLVNPFTMNDPFRFTHALLPNGQIQADKLFTMSSSSNVNSPNAFDFPNFCTALGQQLIGSCNEIGLVSFALDDIGNWSISGDIPRDIGSGGQLVLATVVPVPAAMWLFGSGLIGLIGFAYRKAGIGRAD